MSGNATLQLLCSLSQRVLGELALLVACVDDVACCRRCSNMSTASSLATHATLPAPALHAPGKTEEDHMIENCTMGGRGRQEWESVAVLSLALQDWTLTASQHKRP